MGNSCEKTMEGTLCNLFTFGGNWSASNTVEALQTGDS